MSTGTFTLGHVGPQGLDELIRIARPNALFVIGISQKAWDRMGFASAFDSLLAESKISKPTCEPVTIFGNNKKELAGDMAHVVIFRKR